MKGDRLRSLSPIFVSYSVILRSGQNADDVGIPQIGNETPDDHFVGLLRLLQSLAMTR